jgi:hypothetical protein
MIGPSAVQPPWRPSPASAMAQQAVATATVLSVDVKLLPRFSTGRSAAGGSLDARPEFRPGYLPYLYNGCVGSAFPSPWRTQP